MDSNIAKATFVQRVLIIIVMVGLAAGLVCLSYTLRVLLVDVFLAITLACSLSPIAAWGERYRIPRLVSILSVLAFVAVSYCVVGILLAAPVNEQIQLFKEHIPEIIERGQRLYSELLRLAGDKAAAITPDAGSMQKFSATVFTKTLDVTTDLLGLCGNAAFVVFLAVIFCTDAKHLLTAVLRWIPPAKRDAVAGLLPALGVRVGGYLRGQFLVATCVAVLLSGGLTLIQIKYGLVLGLVAGVLNLVPFVGSFTAFILALLVALNDESYKMILVVLVFAVEQAIESNVLTPFLVGSQVELHPLVIMFAILVGASLGGPVGALVAVPLVTAIAFLAYELYLKPLNMPKE